MAETFKCPSCSAPLDFEGSTIQKCTFCGGSVIVPGEVFNRPKTKNLADLDLTTLTGNALALAKIHGHIVAGRKIEAIKLYRETFGTGLAESKEAVERLERGEGINVSNVHVRTDFSRARIGGNPMRNVALIILVLVIVFGGATFLLMFFVNSIVNKVQTSGQSILNPVNEIATEVFKIGGEGNGPGKFKDNRSITVDGDGLIYSSNYEGGVIQVFGSDGKFLHEIFMTKGPILKALAVDRKGNLFVGNSDGIFLYNGKTGELKKELRINRVESLSITRDQKLVALIKNDFRFFDGDLKQTSEVKGADKSANATSGLEEIAIAPDGSILAFDRENGEICKFSTDGKFLNRISTDIKSPSGLAVSGAGHIYVSNVNTVNIIDEKGKAVGSFKTNQAFGITFDRFDDIFVASRPFVVKYKINVPK